MRAKVLTAAVMLEVMGERRRQNERWGEQNHPNGTSPVYRVIAERHKVSNDAMAGIGSLTWAGILREEVYEALAETDPALLRLELLQVAAVACAWVECLDRNQRSREPLVNREEPSK